MGRLGIKLHDEKWYRTTALDRADAEVVEKTQAEMKELMEQGVGIMLATGGWKKKIANKGESLVNAIALKPSGGAAFLKVIRPGTCSKDGEWIAKTHIDLAMEVTKEKPLHLLGMIMDITHANRKGMRIMAEQYPTWVLLGCVAHALSLLCKNLADPTKCPGVAAVLKVVQTMALVYGDCATIRGALQELQVGGKVGGIRAHCPTRFAILYLIATDVLRMKVSIREMVESSDWASLKEASVNSAVFKHATDAGWWRKLEAVRDLMSPIADAIHQLEGDKAMLSQVLPVWNSLIDHATAWTTMWQESGGTSVLTAKVVGVFEKRFKKHYLGDWAAAYLLDPMNFSAPGTGTHARPSVNQLTGKQRDEALKVVLRLNCMEVTDANTAEVERELSDLEPGESPADMVRHSNALVSWEEVPTPAGQPDKIKVVSVPKRRNFYALPSARSMVPNMCKAAGKLISMHCTSAAAERNWSIWGIIFRDALRNRLGIERAEKLVRINPNLADPTDIDPEGSDDEPWHLHNSAGFDELVNLPSALKT
eukprot:gene10284-8206_t